MNNMDFFDKESFYEKDEDHTEKIPNLESVEDNSSLNSGVDSSNGSFKDKLNKTIFDENKPKKKDNIFTKILKLISTAILTILLCIGAFLIFYVVTTKIASSKGDYPPYGMFTIISPSMEPNIKVYDVVFISRVKDYSKLKVGDVVTFYTGKTFFNGTPITHRIFQVYKMDDGYKYITKGDNNPVEDDFDVTDKNIAGKVLFKLPQLGRVQFFLASKGGWFIAILVPALAILAYDLVKIIKLFILKKKLTEINNNSNF